MLSDLKMTIDELNVPKANMLFITAALDQYNRYAEEEEEEAFYSRDDVHLLRLLFLYCL